jgi:hypothetical protein
MATLANVSTLAPNLSIMGLFNFIYIAKRLRDDILLPQPAEEPEHNAPEILPPSMTRLLADSCNIEIEDVDVLWMELRHLIWDKQDFLRHNLAGTILKYGHGARHTLSPTTFMHSASMSSLEQRTLSQEDLLSEGGTIHAGPGRCASVRCQSLLRRCVTVRLNV